MENMLSDDGGVKPGRTWQSRKARRGESRREQQFYRYYGPFEQMHDYGPKFCDIRDTEARARHRPISCPDKIFTAFCQLGALRLQVRRCLIFFFDINNAYIMAEATRTLSLENDATHQAGDELWMGYSVIPRDLACCENTIELPSLPNSAAAEESAFVVNDLTKHAELSTRSFVTGYPHSRFYAGVPLTTSSGVNIGTYCILSDEVRDGISKEDLIFMHDMSQTIMTHFETVRALAERQQSNRMVAGLGDFVRGASSTGDQGRAAVNEHWNRGSCRNRPTRTVQYRLPDALIDPVVSPVPSPSLSSRTGSPGSGDQQAHAAGIHDPAEGETNPTRRSADSTEIASSNDWKNATLDHQMRTSTWDPQKSSAPVNRSHPARPNIHEEDEVEANSTYQRAAKILCQSLDVDGVAFLDASVRAFGGLSEAQNLESTEGSNGDSDESANIQPRASLPTHMTRDGEPRVCQVLGCAQTMQEDRLNASQPVRLLPQKLTETFLRDLMRRNPHGKVWTFNQDLKAHSDDGFLSEDSGDGEVAPEVPPLSTRHRKASRRDKRSDGEILQSIFPGARCIALQGIWDYTRKRWSVGSLYWTFDPLRLIAKETEMHFVAAFCDVIVAETKRLEILGADKAKSDFISSVSHELRSPLHGILGSCEVLSDIELHNNTASTLVEQIDSCGHTLLEVIDHLLDFANLKSQRLRKGAVKSSKIGRDFLPFLGRASNNNDLKAMNMGVALDELTEDTIVSSVYSFYYNQDADQRTHTPVILDIDRSFGEDWRCNLATGGWKRICMNIVTNALKYTPYGFVRVSLKRKARPGPRHRFYAVLTVADSGTGMSKDFQKNHLFRDFSQEDTQSSGLGLGMHMVSRMVHAMGGELEVTSDQEGTGTRVTVQVPLEARRGSQDRSDNKDTSKTGQPRPFVGLKIGLTTGLEISPGSRKDALKATASAMANASIKKSFSVLGAELVQSRWQKDDFCDLKIVMEAEWPECLLSFQTIEAVSEGDIRPRIGLTPLLVICDHSPSAQILRDLWTSNDLRSDVVIEFIALPCGLKQITRAVNSALDLHKKRREALPIEVETLDKLNLGERIADHDASSTYVQDTITAVSQATPGAPSSAVNITQAQSHLAVFQVPMQQSPPQIDPLPHLPPNDTSPPRDFLSIQPAVRVDPSHKPDSPAPTAITRIPILLLVDDNDINLRLLIAFARKYQFPYVTAVDGQLALDAYKTAHTKSGMQIGPEANNLSTSWIGMPNVILLDINMPRMDGFEACQRIRLYEKEHRLTPSTIIAVTALQSEAARLEAFGSGFNNFVSKPLKLKDLAKLIQGYLVDDMQK